MTDFEFYLVKSLQGIETQLTWIAAHWREALVLDCPCGMKTTLLRGKVIKLRDRSTKRKKKI